jgi:hypothetical protein
MSSNQQFLQHLYDAFNKREIETIVSSMRPDVKWANGLEGGFVYGRDAVREYWTNQFKSIRVETLKFETDENNRMSNRLTSDSEKVIISNNDLLHSFYYCLLPIAQILQKV